MAGARKHHYRIMQHILLDALEQETCIKTTSSPIKSGIEDIFRYLKLPSCGSIKHSSIHKLAARILDEIIMSLGEPVVNNFKHSVFFHISVIVNLILPFRSSQIFNKQRFEKLLGDIKT